MSEPLDLSAPLAPPATKTAPDLTLTPPAPVPVVPQEQAAGMVPVGEAQQEAIAAKAAAFVDDLASVDVRSPEFGQKVAAITSMGEREIRESSQVSNRMLQRPAAALEGTKGVGAGSQAKVAGSLAELRTMITDLDPGKADLKGARRLFGLLPGGDRLRAYFDRYQSAQQQLDAIIRALASGQDELRKDNAAIEAERANMWALMGKLSEYVTLAGALDRATEAKISELRSAGHGPDADTLTSDALFPIRQRRQDLLTQLAVAVQGYLALDLVKKNNVELIKGVDRAQTTTVAALRTAVIVAQALNNQKLVLDQINALNATTNSMIESTSVMLRQQGAQVQQQAAQATVSVETLQRAFDNVFATMEAIDTYKAQAVATMSQTVGALEQQIERAAPYLDRSHAESVRDSTQQPYRG
ncbi:MAG: toxic anion resistance protein [Actinomycetales bacterium]